MKIPRSLTLLPERRLSLALRSLELRAFAAERLLRLARRLEADSQESLSVRQQQQERLGLAAKEAVSGTAVDWSELRAAHRFAGRCTTLTHALSREIDELKLKANENAAARFRAERRHQTLLERRRRFEQLRRALRTRSDSLLIDSFPASGPRGQRR